MTRQADAVASGGDGVGLMRGDPGGGTATRSAACGEVYHSRQSQSETSQEVTR